MKAIDFVTRVGRAWLKAGWGARRRRRLPRRPVSKRRFLANFEPLEGMALMSVGCPVISGFVFLDCNHINPALTNNGLFDVGESGIPNAPVLLRDSTGAVIASTTTDSTGFYSFGGSSLPATPVTITQTLTVPPDFTNFTHNFSPALQLFDPSLGTLQSVKITATGTLASDIQSQNTSNSSGAAITGFVNGTLQVNGLGQAINLHPSAQTATVDVTTFVPPLNFQPPSGVMFPTLTANDTKTNTVTDAAGLALFTATTPGQTITPTLTASAMAGASAPNGNLTTDATTRASGTIQVTYTYLPEQCLTPGNYTIVQNPQVAGFIHGKDSRNGQVLPDTGLPATIPLTLGINDAPNNDFGELVPPPVFTHLVRFGVHHQPTHIVLTFNSPLNPTEAQNVNNYIITPPHQPNFHIPIQSAVYNPGNNTVTLTPVHQLNAHLKFLLTIKIPQIAECQNGTNVTRLFGGRADLGPITGHNGHVFVVDPAGHLHLIH